MRGSTPVFSLVRVFQFQLLLLYLPETHSMALGLQYADGLVLVIAMGKFGALIWTHLAFFCGVRLALAIAFFEK